MAKAAVRSSWADITRDLPRHGFLPRVVYEPTYPYGPVDRETSPDRWRALADSDDPVITQLRDGGALPDNSAYLFTSSCSAPTQVVRMLEFLDAQPGERVLEIGTGTGWNAALLSRVAGQVVTVEIDPAITTHASHSLARAGCRGVNVVTGDGEAGWAPGAPYDRVIATCAIERVPYAWVEQSRPGGVIVTPWGPPFSNEHLLRLTVDNTGATARGRIVEWATFMVSRPQRHTFTDEPDDFPDVADVSDVGRLDLRDVFHDDARIWIGLRVPACRLCWEEDEDGWHTGLWLLAVDSWAHVETETGTVRQAGPRRLWDEVTTAYRAWVDAGRPSRQQAEIVVTGVGQAVVYATGCWCPESLVS